MYHDHELLQNVRQIQKLWKHQMEQFLNQGLATSLDHNSIHYRRLLRQPDVFTLTIELIQSHYSSQQTTTTLGRLARALDDCPQRHKAAQQRARELLDSLEHYQFVVIETQPYSRITVCYSIKVSANLLNFYQYWLLPSLRQLVQPAVCSYKSSTTLNASTQPSIHWIDGKHCDTVSYNE